MFGEMKTGAYVSGAGHLGLFLWLIIGGFFVARDDFEAITVTDVSIITADELQALQPSGPETGDAPPAIEAPSEDQAVETPAPAPAPRPAPEPAPAPAPAPTPEEAPVPDEAPEPPVIEETPEPEGDPGAAELDPDAAPAVPEEAEVITQDVTRAPEPEVEIADTAQSEVAPDEAAEPTPEPQEAQEETAPEETTNQVVTEADETSNSAPTISTRPGRKPTPPPAPAPAQTEVAETPTEQPTTPGLEDLINDAVTEANQDNAVEDNVNPGGGTGEPVTRAEKGAFILAIQRCWNVGALSTDALKVTVTVGFTMTPDAKPEIGSIRLVGAEGGSGAAVDRAYESARRAIIRCGSAGFGLPADKYDQWRGVEVRFNATTKEIR
jgi:hypothetical protein